MSEDMTPLMPQYILDKIEDAIQRGIFTGDSMLSDLKKILTKEEIQQSDVADVRYLLSKYFSDNNQGNST